MKEFWVVALMLFSMFFGAGNFIFPPVVGASAHEFLGSTLAFAISAVALPVLGVAAIARTGSMERLASKVHPIFSLIFGIVIYICIGPLFAIPRASNMPLQLAMPNPDLSIQLIYSAIYYLLNYYLCLNPHKLIDALGKIITPLLIIVLVVLISGVLTIEPEQSSTAGTLSIGRAFIEGYSTMDALASLVFGISVINALRDKGVEEKSLVSRCILAGIIAGVMLAVVYVGLAFCGYRFSAHLGSDGAVLLGALAEKIFGWAGRWVLAVACFLACFSTTLGLVGSGAAHFSKWGGYKLWVGIYCLASFAMSNLGLSTIISASVQLLVILYPPAILLIISVFLPKCNNALRASVIVALFCSIAGAGWLGDGLKQLISGLWGQKDDLGWIAPSVIAYVLVFMISCLLKKRAA